MRKKILERALRMRHELILIRTVSKMLNISISVLYWIVDQFEDHGTEGGRISNVFKQNQKEEKEPTPFENDYKKLYLLAKN